MTALAQIAHLSDVFVEVEVELDRKPMTVREILSLSRGSIISTMRSAGENIVILVGGTPVGSGEIVIIDETVGVRITDFKEDG